MTKDTEKKTEKPFSRIRDERLADQIRKHLAATIPLCQELQDRGYQLIPTTTDFGEGHALVTDYKMACEKEL